MPSNAGSYGVDYSIAYFDANVNALVTVADIQSVKLTAQKHDVANRPYNGPPRFDYIPDGHKFSFTIIRVSADLENMMVDRETSFNNGGFSYAGYLNVTITNPDKTVSRWQYKNFVFFLTDHGDISREKLVGMTGEGMASQKVRLA